MAAYHKIQQLICELTDVPVRAELLEQFPHIALFISENRHLFPSDMPSPFAVCLLPLLLKHMKDISNQVALSLCCSWIL